MKKARQLQTDQDKDQAFNRNTIISQNTYKLSRVREVRICGVRQPRNSPAATTASTPETCERSAGM